MLIDVKQFAKDEGIPISRAVCRALAKYLPKHWHFESKYSFKHIAGTKDCYGDGFSMKEKKNYKYKYMRYKTAQYRLPVAKAETITLDTDAKLLILDDLIAVDVS